MRDCSGERGICKRCCTDYIIAVDSIDTADFLVGRGSQGRHDICLWDNRKAWWRYISRSKIEIYLLVL